MGKAQAEVIYTKRGGTIVIGGKLPKKPFVKCTGNDVVIIKDGHGNTLAHSCHLHASILEAHFYHEGYEDVFRLGIRTTPMEYKEAKCQFNEIYRDLTR